MSKASSPEIPHLLHTLTLATAVEALPLPQPVVGASDLCAANTTREYLANALTPDDVVR